MAETIRRFNDQALKFEYGLDGIRLLPWPGLNAPFGGAYCIVRPHSTSLDHVNSPDDEEELFICISGEAEVVVGKEVFPARKGDVLFIPRQVPHHVRNDTNEPFHFYALWWNGEAAGHYLNNPNDAAVNSPS
jgi:oxalate decarboxylase/phosphoglucose isomerase-like protein (cupin superfamily)